MQPLNSRTSKDTTKIFRLPQHPRHDIHDKHKHAQQRLVRARHRRHRHPTAQRVRAPEVHRAVGEQRGAQVARAAEDARAAQLARAADKRAVQDEASRAAAMRGEEDDDLRQVCGLAPVVRRVRGDAADGLRELQREGSEVPARRFGALERERRARARCRCAAMRAHRASRGCLTGAQASRNFVTTSAATSTRLISNWVRK